MTTQQPNPPAPPRPEEELPASPPPPKPAGSRSGARAGSSHGDLVADHEEAIKAQRNHLLIAKSLINRAIRLQQSAAPEAIAKAAALYDTGTKMESRANKEIIELIRNRPRQAFGSIIAGVGGR